MTITFDPQAIIPVPRMKASTACTVGQAIEAAYLAEKKLPENVSLAREFHRVATEHFKRALFSHLDPVTEAQHAEEARVEAANFSGFHATLVGIANSSIKKKAAIAAKLESLLFTTGLTFLRLQTMERWMQTEAKLTQIKELKLEPEIIAVGCGDFLTAIHETHKALGDAAGITSAIPVTAKSGVQASYDKWKAAVRCYIAQIVANQALAVAMAKSEEEIKAANDLAARLLAPIASIDSSLSARTEEAPPAAPPAAETAAASTPPAAKATPAA